MKFKLEIELGNEAMQTRGDVARVLYDLSRKLKNTDFGGAAEEDYGNTVLDMNGNKVGEWGFEE